VGRFHGFLVVDKPAGWTSHDVVGRVRRLLGQRRIGHAGTLDPAATGVLPLAVGEATRVVEYLADATKAYVAEITLGVETDSYDGDGRVTAVALGAADALRREEVTRALERFLGPQQQVPPMHSAVKIGGERLYEAARRGEEVARPSRRVEFFALDLLQWEPPIARVAVECSKGTYVRSLASDLGRSLGVGGHLSDLVRTRTGPFRLQDAWTLAELAGAVELGVELVWPDLASHPDAVLEAWPALILGEPEVRDWRQGRAIPATLANGACRVYDSDGTWLGIGRGDPEAAVWRPTKVVGEVT
jgi:tRNA pseudouridine55 synthase